MKTSSAVEDEIDAIRIVICEKTKHMTANECNNYVHIQTAL
jgi:hypothetical protein